jgi:bifunctional DNA-binding transcriptional regulator/antitoxin component of YhaV-PrlF toxin-antitoxin module
MGYYKYFVELMELMAILGTTKVSQGGKVTLIESVRERINVKEGDIIVFEELSKGNIIIRKG